MSDTEYHEKAKSANEDRLVKERERARKRREVKRKYIQDMKKDIDELRSRNDELRIKNNELMQLLATYDMVWRDNNYPSTLVNQAAKATNPIFPSTIFQTQQKPQQKQQQQHLIQQEQNLAHQQQTNQQQNQQKSKTLLQIYEERIREMTKNSCSQPLQNIATPLFCKPPHVNDSLPQAIMNNLKQEQQQRQEAAVKHPLLMGLNHPPSTHVTYNSNVRPFV